MPFIKFPQSQLPAPIVEMLFKGLILVRPNPGGTCSIWIHTAPDDHYLIIEIRGRSPAGSDFLVDRHVGPIVGAPLTVSFSSGPAGVTAFQPEPRPFNRRNAQDRRDIGWSIDLEDTVFHPGGNLIIDAAFPPNIEMSNGVFFTADITDERVLDVGRKRGGDYVGLRQILTVLCANISPPAGSTVVLNRTGVSPWPIALPRAGDPANTRYRISVRNDPLSIDFDPTHDELERYYELVRLPSGAVVPPADRFQLEVRPRGSSSRSTDEIPCMPILLRG